MHVRAVLIDGQASNIFLEILEIFSMQTTLTKHKSKIKSKWKPPRIHDFLNNSSFKSDRKNGRALTEIGIVSSKHTHISLTFSRILHAIRIELQSLCEAHSSVVSSHHAIHTPITSSIGPISTIILNTTIVIKRRTPWIIPSPHVCRFYYSRYKYTYQTYEIHYQFSLWPIYITEINFIAMKTRIWTTYPKL